MVQVSRQPDQRIKKLPYYKVNSSDKGDKDEPEVHENVNFFVDYVQGKNTQGVKRL